MPLYFFHIRDGQEFLDHEGTSCTNVESARAEALVTAGSILRDHGHKFWDGSEWRMWVTNEAGETVCSLKFSAERGPLEGVK